MPAFTETIASPANESSSFGRHQPFPALPALKIRTLLIGLVLAVLLPSVVLGIFATWTAVSSDIRAASGRLADTAQALALAMDQEIATQIAALSVFAESPAFDVYPAPPDVTALYGQALRVARRLGVSVNVVRRDGTQLFSTRRPLGTQLPVVATAEVVERVFETGRPAVSNVVVGPIDGQFTAATVVPVFDADRRVIWATEIGFEIEKVRDLLLAAAVPKDGVASLSDAEGAIVARSDSLHQALVGKPINAEGLKAGEPGTAGILRVRTNGVQRVSAFHKLSAAAGWTLVVSQPAAVFDAAWQRPLMVLGGGTVVGLVASMLLASLAARQILGPVRRLGDYARAVAASDGAVLAGGTADTLPPAHILELEVLRRGFVGAEAALRRAADEVHALFQASPVGIARLDEGGRVREANPAMLRIVGANLADLRAGLINWDRVDRPDHQTVMRHASARPLVTAGGSTEAFEKDLVRQDGTRVPVLISWAMRDPDTAAGVAFATDLTELRSKDARFRLFMQRAPAAIAILDAAMCYIAVSERFLADYKLTCESTQSLVGRSHYELFPEIPEHWRQLHRRVLAGETLSAEDDPFPRLDGRVDWVRWELTPWYEADGSIGGIILFSEVITDRKVAQEALTERNSRLGLLLDTVMEGIIQASEDGRIVSANPAAVRLFGYDSEAELIGQPLAILMPNLDAEGHDGYLVNRRDTDPARSIGLSDRELVGVRKDGSTFTHALSISSFRSGNKRFLTSVLRDMTEAKQAEVTNRRAEELEHLVRARTRDLEETQAQLVQAAKMEALGRLASGIAHDFNNVLQAMDSSVTLARKRLGSNLAATRAALEVAAASVERGASVTGRLLAFARHGDLSAIEVNPGRLLNNLAQLLKHTFAPSVKISIEVDPSVPMILADLGQLEMVLVNLANNSRDALKHGVGKIALTAASVDVSAEIPADLKPGSYVRLSVVDDGKGIPSDILSDVVTPFFTTKLEGRGTGLGLSMARRFAEQSGGALTIDSTPEVGTVVSLWLPVAAANDGASESPRAVAESAPRHVRAGLAILLVDDEPAISSVLADLLSEAGHTVTQAANAASALKHLNAGLVPDVLVTDFSMPGEMDGISLIREARNLLPRLPALLVTGHPSEVEDADLAKAVEAGPFAVLRKPFSVKTLEARMSVLLDGGSAISVRRHAQ